MSGVMKRLEELYPDDNLGRGALVRSLQDEVVGDSRPALLLLFGAVGLLLLMACASVANLILTRGLGRERELAIRTSLGAGPLRLFRQLLTESVLLAALGGAAGALSRRGWCGSCARSGPSCPGWSRPRSTAARSASRSRRRSPRRSCSACSRRCARARRRPQAGLCAREGGPPVARAASARAGARRLRARGRGRPAGRRGAAGAQLLEAPARGPGLRSRAALLLAHVSLSGPGYVFPQGWPVHDWPAQSAFTERSRARLAASPGVEAVAFAHQGPDRPGLDHACDDRWPPGAPARASRTRRPSGP